MHHPRRYVHEALERYIDTSTLLHGKTYPNAEVAQNIAQHMVPNRNRSKSFRVFVEGLRACVGEDSVSVRGH